MGFRVSSAIGVALAAAASFLAADAQAVGEMKSGFPTWAERVQHEWTNRARVDPALEMTKCGTPCAEGSCYSVKPPLYWNEWASHSARFHSANMTLAGFFQHDSKCALVSNIKDVFPSPCNGATSCSCVGGTLTGTTTAATRVGMFGVSFEGEIIAYGYGGDPDKLFYLWLYEPSTTTACSFTSANGHRWLLLSATGSVGFGEYTDHSTGDFGSTAGDVYKIPSGSHYPRTGSSVELWANWYDTAGPKTALVNVGGTCSPMALTRGVATNGAYKYAASGLSGCTRYYFSFTDSAGTKIDYPTTGSLGIGDSTCADWDTTRPASGSGCGPCTPACGGKTCGDDGCGGSCGTCAAGTTCSSTGTCACTPACSGKTCGSDGCGGSCGTCPSGQTCNSSGACIPGTCVPSCTGKTCGPDGCGGTCAPGCTAPTTCNSTGTCDCAAPFSKCGTSCIDTSSDPLNCGTCGTKCASGEVCSKGACAGSCAAPLTACGGACVNLSSDSLHCGDCGTACKPGETCTGGVCGGGGGDSGPIDDSGGGDSGTGLTPGDDSSIHGSCGCRTPSGGADGTGALAGLSIAIASVVARRKRRR